MPNTSFPLDYSQRVYAGVLGKIIGVYLGRPFEGWMHDRILRDLGEIWYYVHERRNVPLVVSDDDISGTFTFPRALQDFAEDFGGTIPAGDLLNRFTSAHIGQAWLNYIIENRTILWWGGMGMSTEHTAYMRLKAGLPAPASGSIAANGSTVAEQIGAQIFIDAWAMLCPGDPKRAVDLAGKAGRVSHDGEAVYAAQLIAAMEAQAFIEPDLSKLLDIGLEFIPTESIIHRLASELREARRRQTASDWRDAFASIMQARYGYDKFPGNCHVVPNHGIILLALLWGEDDFQKSLMIANTCGWDTDCNSANVGCLLGIKNGLRGIDAGPDWRGPVADRLLLPTADGGRCISDAASESRRIVSLAKTLAGDPPSAKPTPRFDFALPGSVQGWTIEDSPECRGVATVINADSLPSPTRGLALTFRHLAPGRFVRTSTPTFISQELSKRIGYAIAACPTLYSGQTLRAELSLQSCRSAVDCKPPRHLATRLFIRRFGADDALFHVRSPQIDLAPTAPPQSIEWRIPDTDGCPIADVGIEIESPSPADGTAILHSLTWHDLPNTLLKRPDAPNATMWRQAWVNGVDHLGWPGQPHTYALMNSAGRGLILQGEREWTDYRAEVTITAYMSRACGLAVRAQGMRRYYALLLAPNARVQLIKCAPDETILAQAPFDWRFDHNYRLSLQIKGNQLHASIDGKPVLAFTDVSRPLRGGAVGLIVEEGRINAGPVSVSGVERE